MSFSGFYPIEYISAHRDPREAEDVLSPAETAIAQDVDPDTGKVTAMRRVEVVPAVKAMVTRHDTVTRVETHGRGWQKIVNGECVSYHDDKGGDVPAPKEARVVGALVEQQPW